MEPYLCITQLNDFTFCPRSIYFANIHKQNYSPETYHRTSQKAGVAAHKSVDIGEYSSRKDVLQGLTVYSEKYRLLGKIDTLDLQKKELCERKYSVTAIYDGFRYQVYAQYFALLDIGYTYIFNFIEAMTAIYGFDIYCGVYHTFFYQRKSLICDLVEPFRCIIEQRLRKAHNLNQIDENDFYEKNNQYQLTYKNQSKYTKLFMKDILFHKKEIFLYIQAYYRWFMKNKSLNEFPVFNISGGDQYATYHV